jgi:hypothetical protein
MADGAIPLHEFVLPGDRHGVSCLRQYGGQRYKNHQFRGFPTLLFHHPG